MFCGNWLEKCGWLSLPVLIEKVFKCSFKQFSNDNVFTPENIHQHESWLKILIERMSHFFSTYCFYNIRFLFLFDT